MDKGKKRVVLGIDPGYAILGYGAIEACGNRLKLIDYGVIETDIKHSFPQRLEYLYMQTKLLCERISPDCIVFEELFFSRNTKTAMQVSAARGTCLLAAYQTCLPLYEYTPMQIKSAVCGNGHAEKKQVQEMVRRLLNMDKIPKPDDAADGLAAAICHAGLIGLATEQFRIK